MGQNGVKRVKERKDLRSAPTVVVGVKSAARSAVHSVPI